MHLAFYSVLILICTLMPVGLILAEEAKEAEEFISLTLENDLWGSGEDRHYTHGTKIGYLTTDVPVWLNAIGEQWLCDSCRDESAVEFVLGQNIFTPDNISTTELQEDDRPYAGWLYTGFTLYGVDLCNDKNDPMGCNSLKYDALQLNIGMVGPASLADQTQTFVHELIDSPRPNGWDHQLSNEFGVMLSYTRRWQNFIHSGLFDSLEHDLSPHVVGALGNIYTYVGGGALWRFGRNLRVDAGPNTVRPGLPGASYFVPKRGKGWYLFAGFEGRAMARNIFLDGNTFSDSHSVDKKPFVFDAQFGFAYRWENVRLTLTNVFRSKEFKGQDKSDEYGAITLDFAL